MNIVQQFSHFRRSRWLMPLAALILAGGLLSCTLAPLTSTTTEYASNGEVVAEELLPVEEQQIINVVEDFYARDNLVVPEYIADVQAVENNWARVSIRPKGVESDSGPALIFLQNQVESTHELPAPTEVVTPPRTAPVSTETGWVIVAGPQASFTETELNTAGIPAFIRP